MPWAWSLYPRVPLPHPPQPQALGSDSRPSRPAPPGRSPMSGEATEPGSGTSVGRGTRTGTSCPPAHLALCWCPPALIPPVLLPLPESPVTVRARLSVLTPGAEFLKISRVTSDAWLPPRLPCRRLSLHKPGSSEGACVLPPKVSWRYSPMGQLMVWAKRHPFYSTESSLTDVP